MLNRYGWCCCCIHGKYLFLVVYGNCIEIWGSDTPLSKSHLCITWSWQSQYSQHIINTFLCYKNILWLLNATINVSSFSLRKYSQFSFIFQLSLPLTLIHKSCLSYHIDQISHQIVRTVVIFLSWFPYYHFISCKLLQNHTDFLSKSDYHCSHKMEEYFSKLWPQENSN